MRKSEIYFILISFIIWRVAILIFAALSIKFIPLFSHNYFGGGYSNYITNPLFWGNLNFDGEHYLAIAQNGYRPFQYFFFPLYPKLISLFSVLKSVNILALNGILISNFSFLLALIGIYKLVKLDFKAKIAKLTIILFLIFPTSFYFGAYYTESIFLAIVVWGFYFARNKNYYFASFLGILASATRVIGVVLSLIIALEFLRSKNYKIKASYIREFWPILFSPLGLLSYMYFLFRLTGDAIIFVHQIVIFGQQRSSTIITLPQVYYRYFFEVLPHVSYSFFPNFFTTYLEFGTATLFLILIIYSFWKLRLSYAIYSLLAFLIPTFAGSFSSMPRYVLVIFPIFILSANLLNKTRPVFKYIIFFVMIILLFVSTSLFWRGYWLA
jgi:Gpi18-like mannosyltransferase